MIPSPRRRGNRSGWIAVLVLAVPDLSAVAQCAATRVVWSQPDPRQVIYGDEGRAFLFYGIALWNVSADGAVEGYMTFAGEPKAVAIESDGTVYAVGCFSNVVDFDTGPNVWKQQSHGGDDAFITKLRSDGTHLWTRTFGGTMNDCAWGVGVRPDGNVLIIGTFRGSSDFDPSSDIDLRASDSISYDDAFLTEFDPDGIYLAGVRTFGTGIQPTTMTVISDGTVFLTGSCDNNSGDTTDFDPTAGEDRKSCSAYLRFLSKYNADGSYSWTRTFTPEAQYDFGEFAVDSEDRVLVTGQFSGLRDFDPGDAVELHFAEGGTDVFVTKWNADGSYVWTRIFGGTGDDFGRGVALDMGGHILVAGSFQYTFDFDPGPTVDYRSSHGASDIFLTSFDADGEYVWTETYGTAQHEDGRGLLSAPDGALFLSEYRNGSSLLTKLACLQPDGDFDDDGDRDLRDFAALQTTFTSDHGGPIEVGARRFDVDFDRDIDLIDYATLANLFTGP